MTVYNKNLTNKINFRYDDEIKEIISNYCIKYNISISDFIRLAILNVKKFDLDFFHTVFDYGFFTGYYDKKI